MSIVIRCLSLRIRMSDSPACASLPLMWSRILTSSISAAAKSLLPVYQFDFQSWMTPTRMPPGWIFWPIGLLLLLSSAGSLRLLLRRCAFGLFGGRHFPSLSGLNLRPAPPRGLLFRLAHGVRLGLRGFRRRAATAPRLCGRFERLRGRNEPHGDVTRGLADARNAPASACSPALDHGT